MFYKCTINTYAQIKNKQKYQKNNNITDIHSK